MCVLVVGFDTSEASPLSVHHVRFSRHHDDEKLFYYNEIVVEIRVDQQKKNKTGILIGNYCTSWVTDRRP